MDELIEQLKKRFEDDLAKADSTAALDDLKMRYLGKRGAVQELMVQLKTASAEERPLFGKQINDLKYAVKAKIEHNGEAFARVELEKKLAEEVIDITLPSRRMRKGGAHPISAFIDRACTIFSSMGFSIALGPEVELEYYNFTGLNFAEDHPARDMQDTFWITGDKLLRTHTTNIQLRAMEAGELPLRMIAPGRVFRNEDVSARSHVLFHQIDGFYIDKEVSFTDLLSTLKLFLTRLFGKVATRFRPSYFPFVEPGLEADIACLLCHGSGCRICKGTGWLEILGAGMIHPNVLENGGIDPEQYSGFAFGMGIERLVMILNKIPDIRLFLENDLRFLSQLPS